MPPKKQGGIHISELVPGTLFGQFSNPLFLHSGPGPDEKKKGKGKDKRLQLKDPADRFRGIQFKIPSMKEGHGSDAYFGKTYLTLASSEQHKDKLTNEYVDSDVADRRAAAASKKKRIGDKDWIMASVPKKSCGTGSYAGTFGGIIEHKSDYTVLQRGTDALRYTKKMPRNIMTAPGKKGAFGTPGILFSGTAAPDNSDVYNQARLDERTAWEASKKKMLAPSMFKTTVRTNYTFDEKGQTGISSLYDHYEAKEDPKAKKRKKQKERKPTAAEKRLAERSVFRYSSPPKSGTDGYLGGFPNGEVPPELLPKEPKGKGKKSKKKERPPPKPLGGPWKPVQGGHSAVCRSMLRRFY